MSNMDGVSLLAFLKSDADIKAMHVFAQHHGLGDDAVLKGDITNATEYLADKEPPSLLIVEIPSAGEAEALLDKLADVCAPDTKVVIAGNINEYSFFLWLQEIGIFHYLLLPLTDDGLEALYQKVITDDQDTGTAGKTPGKTIGLMGTRGGSGATSLSVLLGALMAKHAKKDTCVLELDPLDGTAALLLDVEPSHGLREALEKPERIDEIFLERVMIKMNEHLSIISAEESLSNAVEFHEEAADSLIPVLKKRFDFSFLDISHHFNPFSLKAAQLCDQIYVISPMNLQGLRDAMRINEWLRDKCDITHHQFIGNRVGEMENHEVLINDFEKSLGTKLACTIPFSPTFFSEITNDLSVLKKTSEEGFEEFAALAKLVNPSLKISEEADKKGKKPKKIKKKPLKKK